LAKKRFFYLPIPFTPLLLTHDLFLVVPSFHGPCRRFLYPLKPPLLEYFLAIRGAPPPVPPRKFFYYPDPWLVDVWPRDCECFLLFSPPCPRVFPVEGRCTRDSGDTTNSIFPTTFVVFRSLFSALPFSVVLPPPHPTGFITFVPPNPHSPFCPTHILLLGLFQFFFFPQTLSFFGFAPPLSRRSCQPFWLQPHAKKTSL